MEYLFDPTSFGPPAPGEMGRFLAGLRRFVLDEAHANRERIHQIWSQPLEARVADGHAIDGVRIVGSEQDGSLRLACRWNESRFREGDLLCLNLGNPFAAAERMVTLDVDGGTDLIVSSEMSLHIGELEQNRTDWILDIGYLDMSQWVLDALDEAADTDIGRRRVVPLLMGAVQPEIDFTRYEKGLRRGARFRLNDEQRTALACAYATDSTYLIQGPPGTGKTYLLAALVEALVADGERVLVTAFTHRAINNALNKIAAVAPAIPAAKIGHHTRTRDLRVPNFENFAASPMADTTRGYALGATPYATRTSRLAGVRFDTVIFDEASQITIPLAVMGMLTAEHFIFIGDQKQLPPVVVSGREGVFKASIFQCLVERGFDTMLTTTYRLSDELAAWSSFHFYQGRLRPAPHVARQRIAYPQPPAVLGDILDPDAPKVFWDLGHRHATTYSDEEARAVARLVDALLACGHPAREIAVVVPYRNQARQIRTRLGRLAAALAQPDILNDLVVDTVERMQGQERDLIIISLTTSNPAFAERLAPFFFQLERLNVAATRARKKLIIIGSRHVLRAAPEDPALAYAVEVLHDLLSGCATIRAER